MTNLAPPPRQAGHQSYTNEAVTGKHRQQQRETFIPLSHDPGERAEEDLAMLQLSFPTADSRARQREARVAIRLNDLQQRWATPVPLLLPGGTPTHEPRASRDDC